ncbi:hypothetical protein [Clostridium manihotivorum]|uniref:Uncharacterized protein n=1 Tax=Clostridium manihotivorum TaxID=2320868 RepID=A0A410DXH5_9CLOT|nr:hypothetical protein [Clostridium manihotivorum]QAA33632.1 hypothetical protein C1I91_19430 [Clostridium manihotivorum]
MKRKLLLSLISIVILLSVFFYNSPTDYSGRYYCTSNSNILLILKTDNSFELYNTLNKDFISTDGEYSISDNCISLKYSTKIKDSFASYPSYGKISGRNISFYPSIDSTNLKFMKS